MKFLKTRNVKSPVRGTDKSAGIDFFIPEDFEILRLFPGDDVLIPSGIKVNLPKGYMLMAANKSGVVTSKNAVLRSGRTPKKEAFNSNLIVGAEIVDEDYQGEIHIHLINVGNHKVILEPSMKIAQFILVPVAYAALEEVSDESELFDAKTMRADGGFGSTDKR